ncbi:MAG: T9SS type A sorting domain-containing protein [Bacteroidia bacterium]
MADRTRISRIASEFAAFMQRTDNLQLAAGTPPTTRKWQNWGWSVAQSRQWTAYRNQCDLLYPQYADPKHVNTDMLGNTVKQFIIYNDPEGAPPFQISTADLSEGVYIISISSNEGVMNKRVVIVK